MNTKSISFEERIKILLNKGLISSKQIDDGFAALKRKIETPEECYEEHFGEGDLYGCHICCPSTYTDEDYLGYEDLKIILEKDGFLQSDLFGVYYHHLYEFVYSKVGLQAVDFDRNLSIVENTQPSPVVVHSTKSRSQLFEIIKSIFTFDNLIFIAGCFYPREIRDILLGDITEKYIKDVERVGSTRAKFWIVADLVRSIYPFFKGKIQKFILKAFKIAGLYQLYRLFMGG